MAVCGFRQVVQQGSAVAVAALLVGTATFSKPVMAQRTPTAAPVQAAAPATAQGGTIKGTIVAGTAGKPGGVPLPGVTVTAKNSITGKQYTTTTDVDGVYEMKIPRNGRYVVRAEFAGFALATQEVVLNGVQAEAALQGITIAPKPTDFGLQLASRVAEAKQTAAANGMAATLGRGTQSLSLTAGGLDAEAAGTGGNSGVQLPSLGGLGDSVGGDAGGDSIAISGQQGQTNGLANFSEDELRQRVQDAVAQGQASGMIPPGGDPTNAIVGMLSGMMNGGGPGSGGGRGGNGGGGGRGSRGGGGGGGSFRNFNPAQPHGSIFYQGGNSALNSAPWSPNLTPVSKPESYSNNYGLTIAGSPYIPGLTKPNTKQFVFLNLTGKKNLSANIFNGTVPTALERAGNFLGATTGGSSGSAITLYDPITGAALLNNNLANASVPISQTALNLINAYYPLPNIAANAQGNNYQTITNAGNNSVAINTRYVRTLGAATNTPAGRFGGGGGGGGGRQHGKANAPPSLRQNINLSYNFSHSAADQRQIFLPLGGATANDGNAVTAGYTIGYGRLSNNASLGWNRSNSQTRNYFTNTSNDPTTALGIHVPNLTGGFANPRFYNGLPSLSLGTFTGINNTTPSQTINQTISFSDFVAYRHKKHNMRYGFDIRRVHNDVVGGNNPLGSLSFTGYATESPTDKAGTAAATTSGSGFADFLLGLPQTTSLQAGLYKIYLRENVFDWYVTDDYRVAANWTLNYGLRYEYFAPYTEKNNRLVNLTGVSDNGVTQIGCVTPTGTSYPTLNGTSTVTCAKGTNASLVNSDHAMYSPRFGFAWKPKMLPKLTKDVVIRGGYGINFNTGAFATFAQSLSRQAPFATTQTNTLTSGCTTITSTSPTVTASTMTLANGFNCSTLYKYTNNYAVDPNYKLGLVQVYNLNIQKTLPLQTVLNVGYTGSKGSFLDFYGTPDANSGGSTQQFVAPFDYETSDAESRSNQLVVSLQARQQHGVALGGTYTYSHTIDDASAVGNGASHSPVQNFYNIRAEESNSSFDQRHNLTGNWLIELPFGPNRPYLNKGGVLAKIMDGYSFSGTFTFATGTYLTPQYTGSTAEAGSGNTYVQRPNRDYTMSTKGKGTVHSFFNINAFSAPTVVNGVTQPGSAAPDSIEGPGTVSVAASLSRTIQFSGTSSFEARVTATNLFNTVQYSGIGTNLQSTNTFGEVTSAAAMRALQVQARYRF